MVDCICGFGKAISDDEASCPICGADVTPLHRIRKLPGFFYAKGLEAVNEGQDHSAIECLSTAVSLEDSSPKAYELLGDIHFKKAMFREALHYYGKALQLEPDNEDLKKRQQDAQAKATLALAEGGSLALNTKRRTWTPWLVLSGIAFLLGLAVFPTLHLLSRKVGPVPVDYALLSATVKRQLADEPVLKGISVGIAESGSGLHISGEVPTEMHKKLVSEMVSCAVGSQIPVVIDLRVPHGQEVQAESYTVRSGDSLTSLAAAKYGDSRMWTKIYAANRGKLSRPNGLSIGQVLSIPR